MSKYLLYALLLPGIFSACKNEKNEHPVIDYTGFVSKEILLTGVFRDSDDPDTIAKLFIKIPSRLDTFYQWHRTSDCRSCGALQYRFADLRYKQFAEGGFFWTYVPDSVYQLTVSHDLFWIGPDSVIQQPLSLKDTPLCAYLPNHFAQQGEITYLKKEFKEINSRGFLISAFTSNSGEMTMDTTLYLTAMTRLKKRTLNFIAECGAKDTTGFIENMYKSILSIKIKEQ